MSTNNIKHQAGLTLQKQNEKLKLISLSSFNNKNGVNILILKNIWGPFSELGYSNCENLQLLTHWAPAFLKVLLFNVGCCWAYMNSIFPSFWCILILAHIFTEHIVSSKLNLKRDRSVAVNREQWLFYILYKHTAFTSKPCLASEHG